MRWLAVLITLLLASGCFKRQGGSPPTGDDPEAGVLQPDEEPSTAVPTEPLALFDFLESGDYKGFAADPLLFLPAGPHGVGGIRVFFNSTLDASLDAAAFEHPKDSAAIAELYGVDAATLIGWAVSVKVAADSAGGLGWYWYEVESTTDPSLILAQGRGVGFCAGCHAAGDDYVLTPRL